MTLEEIKNFISQEESENVERKVGLSDKEKVYRTVCAFSNDINNKKESYIIFGVDDLGNIQGIASKDEQLKKLSEIRDSGNIQPLPQISIETFTLGEKEIIVLKVKAHFFPPVRYKGQVWIRVGPTTRLATEQEERSLIEKRNSSFKTFDLSPCLGSSLNDLDILSFLNEYLPQAFDKETLDANERSIEFKLASLRFYDTQFKCPTNAGILVFGKDPSYFLLGAYIQYVLWDADTIGDGNILDQKEIRGNLFYVMRQLELIIEVNNRITLQAISNLQEKERPEYPKTAIREFLLNAIMHRDYESNAPVRFYWFHSHIEIQNPGGLYGASALNFPNQNDYRNPILAEALKTLGYVNKFGHGILRAKAELQKNGNPEPEFITEKNYFLVKIFK